MNELHFAYRVKQHLNQGLQDLDDETVARLKAARKGALAVQKQPSANPVLAVAGHFFRFHLDGTRTRHVLAALAAAAAVAFYAHWQADELVANLSDVDSALLSDDVPVEALLDKDFDQWLKSSRQE